MIPTNCARAADRFAHRSTIGCEPRPVEPEGSKGRGLVSKRSGRRASRFVAAALWALLACACTPGTDPRLAEVERLQEDGEWSASLEPLHAVLATAPDHMEANWRLGLARLRLGEPGLAVWPLEVAAGNPSSGAQVELALGSALVQLDDERGALAAAERARAEAKNDAERRGALALELAAQVAARDVEAAEVAARALTEQDAAPADVRLVLAELMMLEERPDEAQSHLEAVWRETTPDRADLRLRAGLALAALYQEGATVDEEGFGADRAAEQLEQVREAFPTHPHALAALAALYDGWGDPTSGTDAIRKAVAAAPDDFRLRQLLAARLVQLGDLDAAERAFREAAESEENAHAWIGLAELLHLRGRPTEALEAARRAAAAGEAFDDPVRLRLGELMLIGGDLDGAAAQARALVEPAHRAVLQGFVAWHRGDAAAALAQLDRGLRRWPNHAGARDLAGRAALWLGDTERGRAELVEAVRIAPAATNAAVDLARWSLEQGDAENAAYYSGLVLSRPLGAPRSRILTAATLQARARMAMGDDEGARRTLEDLSKTPDGAVWAAIESARLEAHEAGPATAAAGLAAREIDWAAPEAEPALRALVDYRLQAGESRAAVEAVRLARRSDPERPSLIALEASALLRLDRIAEARAVLESAGAAASETAVVQAALSRLTEREGDLESALEHARIAATLDPSSADLSDDVAQLSLLRGDIDGAIEALDETLRRDRLHIAAANDLAWLLAEQGRDLGRARRLADRAVAEDRSANHLDTLGWVALRSGDAAGAVRHLEAALALSPESASIRYRLGLASLASGDPVRARTLIEEALSSGPFLEAAAARAALSEIESSGSPLDVSGEPRGST